MESPRGHVFLAEDDEDYREIVSEWLRHSGFEVTVFESGDALLEAALRPENPPFAVLTDLYMKGMSGFEVVAELRTAYLLHVIPVAVHSATAVDAFPDADVLGVPKPVDLQELTLILDCLCADAEKRVAERNLRLRILRGRRQRAS